MYLNHDEDDLDTAKVRKCNIPMAVIDSEREGDSTPVDQRDYLMVVVGGLNYLAQYIRPDLLFAMSIIAQKCSMPTMGDMRMVRRILKYIESTPDYGLSYCPGKVELYCHVDAAHNCYDDAIEGIMGILFH